MGVRVVWIDGKTCAEGLLRLGRVAFFPKRDREVIVGHGVFRIGLECAIQDGDRVVEAALTAIDITQVHRGENIVGLQGDGFFQSDLGGREFARLDLSDGEVGEGEVVFRGHFHDALVFFLGVGEASLIDKSRGLVGEFFGLIGEGLRASGGLALGAGGLDGGEGEFGAVHFWVFQHHERFAEEDTLLFFHHGRWI